MDGSVSSSTLPTTTAPSTPALLAMVFMGTLSAFAMICGAVQDGHAVSSCSAWLAGERLGARTMLPPICV
jgi:hypothetical protein